MISEIPFMVVLHAGCALVYTILCTLILVRRTPGATSAWLALACLTTALWAVAVVVYSDSAASGLPGWLELARVAAWYGFILHLYRRSVATRGELMQAFSTMGLLALLVVGGLALTNLLESQAPATLWLIGIGVRLGIAVCGLLLLENLWFNTPPEARWHVNLLCVALGGMFLYDLVLYSDAALFRAISRPLFESRAAAAMIAAPLLAVAAVRDRSWKVDIHVSRDVVFHSFTLVMSGVFLMGLALTGELFRGGDADWAHVAEVSLLCCGVVTIAVVLTSGSMRSRMRAVLVDHFFSHRYDYRREWMRCIDTLSMPDTFANLHERAIRAVAEVVDSPGGVLFLGGPKGMEEGAGEVGFHWAGSLNTPPVTTPVAAGHAAIAALANGDRIAVLEELPGAASWFGEIPRCWLAVPLNHRGELIGFVVLTRSRAGFRLDREVFQLLRVVGREVASRVAEEHAARFLSQTRDLRDYSQRFAFVLHDIKNVSGQLSMLLANAELHADNPEFQRDMLATVRASVGKIASLLTRLRTGRQESGGASFDPIERLRKIVEVAEITGSRFWRDGRTSVQIAAGRSRLAAEPADLRPADAPPVTVAIDIDSFDAVATHLLNNAIEASTGSPASPETSSPGANVRVEVTRRQADCVIDITDEGPGMSPEFIRDELFRPFSSTKGGGHGIGAFQARELLREAGGDLLVLSRVGSGTTMRLLLPMVTDAASDSPRVAA
jgi:putative PEP-CTERM system histidine kinase